MTTHHTATTAGRQLLRALAAAALLLAVCATPAAAVTVHPVAKTITRQAASANAAFLAYAPAPPVEPGAMCLVDTGVNAIADTAPVLVSATALDGGSGADADPLVHGTINAAIAAGQGHGIVGAWPRLKIVSVRATDVPPPGQRPSYQYDDYVNGINECSRRVDGARVLAIALPLSSKIPPTPDQVDDFVNAAAQASGQGISILAAAGNEPGEIQLPASQPGVLAVGAWDTFTGAICADTPTVGLAFFAPGCVVDTTDASNRALCCGNGSSQATAFAAAVLVALRSYAPQLSAEQAVQLLVSTTSKGQLDASAAFRAAGLGAIVDAGNAAIPQPPRATEAAARLSAPRIRRATWRKGALTIVLRAIPKGARLNATLSFARRKALRLSTTKPRLRAHVPRPTRVRLRFTRGGQKSATVSVTLFR